MPSPICTPDETAALLERSRASAAAMEGGRGIKDRIFASSYVPLLPPLRLPPLPTDATDENIATRFAKNLLPKDTLPYRSRSQEGITELQSAFREWLDKEGISYEGDKNIPNAIGAMSVENTLLPNLLRIRRSGGLCRQGDQVLVCGAVRAARERAEENGLIVNAVSTVDAVTKELEKNPETRVLFIANRGNTKLTPNEIRGLAAIVKKHNAGRTRPLIVVADETTPGADTMPRTEALAKNPDLKPYTIALNGLPGAGPEVGFVFAYGPPALMKEVADASFDGPPLATQQYAAAVLRGENPEGEMPVNAPLTGTPELRARLNAYLNAAGITYDAPEDEPRFVCGTSINSTLLPNLFRPRTNGGLCQAGDEVLVCTPIYGLLPHNAHDNQMKLIALQGNREKRYKPDAAVIRQALQQHENARVLMIVNPSNPTGTCLSAQEIDEIGMVVEQHNKERERKGQRPLIVVADETFSELMWTRSDAAQHPHRRPSIIDSGPACKITHDQVWKFTSMASNEKLRPYTISLNTFSKSLAPGLGFAYAYGPPALIKELASTKFDGAARSAQDYAAKIFDPEYYGEVQRHLWRSLHIYEHKYQLLCGHMKDFINTNIRRALDAEKKAQAGYTPQNYIDIFTEPDGGFHVTLDVNALKGYQAKDKHGKLKSLRTAADFAEALMRETGVVVYPGEMFLLPGEDMLLRMSLNLPVDRLPNGDMADNTVRALERIGQFCSGLIPPGKTQPITPRVPSGPGRGTSTSTSARL